MRLPPRQRGDELESSRNVLSSAVAPWPRRRESCSTARAPAVIRRRGEAARFPGQRDADHLPSADSRRHGLFVDHVVDALAEDGERRDLHPHRRRRNLVQGCTDDPDRLDS